MKIRKTKPTAPAQSLTIDLGVNRTERARRIKAHNNISDDQADKVRGGMVSDGRIVEAEYIDLGNLLTGAKRTLEYGEYVVVKGVPRWPSKRGARPMPQDSDHHSGIVMALRLKVGEAIGDSALLVYLDLLDRAAGVKDRIVRGVSMATMAAALGMSLKRHRLAMERLNAVGLVGSRDEAIKGGEQHTKTHLVPFPNTLRIDLARRGAQSWPRSGRLRR